MEKLVVTGGCGFIGSNFIRMVLEKEPNIQVVNFDLLTYAGNLANLKDLENNPRLKFFKGDIANKQDVDSVLKDGVTSVIHFAAESHVDRSILDSGPFIRSNIVGTQVLLDSARAHKITRLSMFQRMRYMEAWVIRGISQKIHLLLPIVLTPPARLLPTSLCEVMFTLLVFQQ
jgi:dTDP-D-glucose 4,6-dehydratase